METSKLGFTNASARTRQVEAFISRQNESCVGYRPSGSIKCPRCFQVEHVFKHCKDIP